MPFSNPKSVIQPKLAVTNHGNRNELEAESMADRVMSTEPGNEVKPVTGLIGTSLQRKCARCEEEEKRGKPVMRKTEAGNSGMSVSSSFAASLNASKGSGSPLPMGTRRFMENAFSAGFSSVKIHTGSRASEMSKGINAKAFTHGNDIYFNDGQYNTDSSEGKHLLAHELTHTVQQGSNIQRNLIQRSADTCTYGEIREYAILNLADLAAPAGLADARASIGAVCSRGQPCNCIDGSAATAPGDAAAWRNITTAVGGTDLSNGGNFMCVDTEACWFVHQCRPFYQRGQPRPPLRERTANLQPVGTVAINGHTLYFYSDPGNGNCPP